MITFDIPTTPSSGEIGTVYQEGIIKDSLNAAAKAANIDSEQVKEDWKNSDGVIAKGNIINDTAGKAIDTADNIINNVTSKNTTDGRSIVARAKNSVMQFPIYVTQTLRVNEAHIISKLFERVYASLIQSVLSQYPIMDEDEANDLVFLKKFHTNIKEAADILTNVYYEPIDDMDRILKESVYFTQQLTENCSVTFQVSPVNDKDLIAENTRLLNDPLSGFSYLITEVTDDSKKGNRVQPGRVSETSETSKKITRTYVKEDELIDIAKGRLNANDRKYYDMSEDEMRREAEKHYDAPNNPGTRASKEARDDYERNKKQYDDKCKQMIDDMKDRKDSAKRNLEKELDKVKQDIKDGKMIHKAGEYRYDKTTGRYYKVNVDESNKTTKRIDTTPVLRAVDAPQLLRDSDIKKINGMLPYQIIATFRLRTSSGVYSDVQYILGVKSVLHLIYAQDLADELHELVTGNVRRLQKVRYKTGEISFMDYMFNIKGLKSDAAKNINYNKRWINTLKRLAEYNRTHGSLLKKPTQLLAGGNVPIPNGTLILTQSDVTMLVNQTGIDLSKISNAKRLAKSLFLIAVVVVDPSAGSMRVLFPDRDNDWDVQSLASIDAEVSKTDNSQLMRELNRLVNHK